MAEDDESWEIARRTVAEGRLSVIMPVFNLAGSIRENLLATAELFASHGLRTELVPVDDGSSDGTAEALRSVPREVAPCVAIRPVFLAKNGGKFVEGFGKYALKFATQLANFRRNPPKRLLQGKNEQERK